MPGASYSIGRAKDNDIVLNDRRVSRKHARVTADGDQFTIVDGYFENGSLIRSVNHVFVNGTPMLEKRLEKGDMVVIGESNLEFVVTAPPEPTGPLPEVLRRSVSGEEFDAATVAVVTEGVNYDDKPLGHTQVQISANEIIGRQTHLSIESTVATPEEIKDLRRKAKMLELLYEMSKSIGTVFDLKEIFEKATDLIFRGTPADRVVALIADETVDGKILDYSLFPIAVRTRDESTDKLTSKLTISRTITQKVMREKVAVLSQDAKTDDQFLGSDSIVSQGVRSTICAPLITESNVHGVLYADRLDPFATFSADHLEMISAVAAQTAVTVDACVQSSDRSIGHIRQVKACDFLSSTVDRKQRKLTGTFRRA